jgi:hypothetical protein
MTARDAYEIKVTRGSSGPAWLSARDRLDVVEVVEIASGEVVLLWDLPPRDAARLARRLRESMLELDAAAFLAAWRDEPPA